ncbi:MAG: RNA methyltransferase [Chloroflexi bacterium]|nr:RNA methyltransferase [Chloroflexota bacterium]
MQEQPSIIQSSRNQYIRKVRSLQNSARSRAEEQLFALESERLIDTALASGLLPSFVLHRPQCTHPQLAVWVHAGIPCFAVAPALFHKLTSVETSFGMIAIFPIPTLPISHTVQSTVVLDAIRDPGNLGTILRSAQGAGVDRVLLAPECADLYNPKVVRAAAGAHFHVPTRKLNWEEIDEVLACEKVFLADSTQGMDYRHESVFPPPWALIVSNEAHGPSPAAQAIATVRLHIPLENELDSLNAATAASILMFEARRQMNQRPTVRNPNRRGSPP